jgi:hypothetical protein
MGKPVPMKSVHVYGFTGYGIWSPHIKTPRLARRFAGYVMAIRVTAPANANACRLTSFHNRMLPSPDLRSLWKLRPRESAQHK